MPRGKSLTGEEKGKIKVYHEIGLSNREISRRLGRSSCVIDNFINKGPQYGTKKRPGRTPLVTNRAKREMKRLLIRDNLCAKELMAKMDLGVGVRRVQQIIKKDLKLSYETKCAKPELLPRHKLARLRFAEKHRFWREEWRTVIFTDEKKFNLDGPDGGHKYWRSKNDPKIVRKRRNFGGGSLMVWGGIGYNGTTPICFVSTRMDSVYYIQLLDDVLINFGDEIATPEFIFQQDNAAIHRSRATKEFLSSRNIPTFDWPALSPDLNPIENLWSLLSSKVFHHGRQFKDVKELKQSIQEEWKNIDNSYVQTLINSMPRRMEEVIAKKGNHTSY